MKFFDSANDQRNISYLFPLTLMQIVCSHRHGGKKTKAVEWVKKDPRRLLVVLNRQEQDFILREFDIAPSQVITVGDLQRSERALAGRRYEPELVFDNIERVIHALLTYPY